MSTDYVNQPGSRGRGFTRVRAAGGFKLRRNCDSFTEFRMIATIAESEARASHQ